MADRIIKSIALGSIAIELDPAGELEGHQRRNLEYSDWLNASPGRANEFLRHYPADGLVPASEPG